MNLDPDSLSLFFFFLGITELVKLHCSNGCNITVHLSQEVLRVETKALDLQIEEIMSEHEHIVSCIEDGLALDREVSKILIQS